MADQKPPRTETHTRETHVSEKTSSGSSMAFIVGGLVVAVAVIAWFVFAGGEEIGTAGDGGGDVNVSVDGAESAAEGTAEAVEDSAENAGEAVEGAAAEAEAEATTNN